MWRKSKLLVHERDTIFNTGDWKLMVFEMVLTFIMVYPNLYGVTYHESTNMFQVSFVSSNYPDVPIPVAYDVNDLILSIMIYVRFHFLIRAVLNLSEHKQPRA